MLLACQLCSCRKLDFARIIVWTARSAGNFFGWQPMDNDKNHLTFLLPLSENSSFAMLNTSSTSRRISSRIQRSHPALVLARDVPLNMYELFSSSPNRTHHIISPIDITDPELDILLSLLRKPAKCRQEESLQRARYSRTEAPRVEVCEDKKG